MSFAKLQIKAAATAFALFACASLALFFLVRSVGNVAAVLPLARQLPAYSPVQTIGAVLDLRPVIALGAGTLLAAGVVLVIRNAFLDRAVYMLISMLTLVLASSIGIVAGFGAYHSIIDHKLLVPPGLLPSAIALGVMMVLSLANFDGLRSSLLLRTLLAPVLVVGAPILLIIGG
ncbi:MAG TPA: hypothetical protein VL418_02095 [Devosiaceae bacterium]|nr:hypothetical protein [Devosiaceae bacterium]